MAAPKKKKKQTQLEIIQAAVAAMKAKDEAASRYKPPTVESPLPPRNVDSFFQKHPDLMYPYEDQDMARKEFDQRNRRVPAEQIPELANLQRLVASLVGVPQYGDRMPKEVVTWGDDSVRYNQDGVYAHKDPDVIGASAINVAPLMRSPKYSPEWMSGIGTLANELTHYNQNLAMGDDVKNKRRVRENSSVKVRDFNNRWAPPFEQMMQKRAAGEYDDSPWRFNKQMQPVGVASQDELQSTLIDKIVRDAYTTQQQMEQFQQAAQTPQGQAASKVLQNLAFDHFFGHR